MPALRHEEFVLPGAQVYPEGITEGPGNTLYVGSIDTGTIFRGDLEHGVAEVWLPFTVLDLGSVAEVVG